MYMVTGGGESCLQPRPGGHGCSSVTELGWHEAKSYLKFCILFLLLKTVIWQIEWSCSRWYHVILKAKSWPQYVWAHYLENDWRHRLSYNGAPIGMASWVSNGHVTLKGQGRVPDIFAYKSWKPLGTEARFRWTINGKWPMANQMVTLLKFMMAKVYTLRVFFFVVGGIGMCC